MSEQIKISAEEYQELLLRARHSLQVGLRQCFLNAGVFGFVVCAFITDVLEGYWLLAGVQVVLMAWNVWLFRRTYARAVEVIEALTTFVVSKPEGA